jgi:uncharacterized membrane protein
MRKWIPALLVLAGYAFSAAVYSRLPEVMPFDFRGLLPMETADVPDMMPRWVGALLLPSLALAMLFLMHEAPESRLGRMAARLISRGFTDAPPLEYHKFADSYRLIVAWIVSLVLSMHLAMIAVVLGWSFAPGTIVGVVLGAGLLVIGNLMPRLRPNAVAGIRTASTLRDPLLWARVHRIYGALWLVAGVAVIVVAVAAPRWAFAAGVGALLLSSLAMLFVTPSLNVARAPK